MFIFVNELVKHMLDKSILAKSMGFNGVHILLCLKWSLKNLSSGMLHYVLATGNEAPDSIKLSEGFPVMGKQPLCICWSTVGDLDSFWFTSAHLFNMSWWPGQQLPSTLIEEYWKRKENSMHASLEELLVVLLDYLKSALLKVAKRTIFVISMPVSKYLTSFILF